VGRLRAGGKVRPVKLRNPLAKGRRQRLIVSIVFANAIAMALSHHVIR
jgi:hypothetical protein